MKVLVMVLSCVCLLLALVGLTELDILPGKLIAPKFLLGVAFYLCIKFLGIQINGDGGTGHDWSDCGGGGEGGDGEGD